jgi:hypothetical protein
VPPVGAPLEPPEPVDPPLPVLEPPEPAPPDAPPGVSSAPQAASAGAIANNEIQTVLARRFMVPPVRWRE